jgi:division protein CdvB (Snf7/Vps24/ESCRT-III family)
MPFRNKWTKTGRRVSNNLLGGIKPHAPLKLRMEEAQHELRLQISKLESISFKMQEKDQLIFKRVVQALRNHETQYVKALSGELSQVRKMNKMVSSARLALEQGELRLNTINELGDVVVVTLSPMSVIKGVQGGLSCMVPGADHSFG